MQQRTLILCVNRVSCTVDKTGVIYRVKQEGFILSGLKSNNSSFYPKPRLLLRNFKQNKYFVGMHYTACQITFNKSATMFDI